METKELTWKFFALDPSISAIIIIQTVEFALRARIHSLEITNPVLAVAVASAAPLWQLAIIKFLLILPLMLWRQYAKLRRDELYPFLHPYARCISIALGTSMAVNLGLYALSH